MSTYLSNALMTDSHHDVAEELINEILALPGMVDKIMEIIPQNHGFKFREFFIKEDIARYYLWQKIQEEE
mgnify:CR=1 FL=1